MAAYWGLRVSNRRVLNTAYASLGVYVEYLLGLVASILIARMESTDPGVAMPELGRATVHREGVAMLRRWIAAMPTKGASESQVKPSGS